MCRFCAVAALLLSVAPLCAADPKPADDGASASWFQRIFGSSKPKPEPKPESVAEKPPTWQDVSRSLDQEFAVYIERLNYCTQLRVIADRSNDAELLKKANDLEALAEQVYLRRTRTLPSIVNDVKAAEASLDRQSGAMPSGYAQSGRNATTSRATNGRPVPRDQNP